MLDNETKRRIDTARDVLVGKIPDPKSQVEQITIALVYKFMDDMDRESIDMGGKASFFTGEYKKYAWSKMFDPRLGGFEMLALYSDAIAQMTRNTGIPQLFRDIFKNAYLPYRDPETLRLFLKTINEFTYDHSERLGDAFEYLLSVLGSQGDAGQFRTPRHIIDFMVQVVDPKIKESILDPACGTAGFLISAYKHILRTNTKKTPGDLLKHDERTKLYSNFKGYDISPDMVRLALVNMYLHGFVQPLIFEYDTLTSEDRWHEYADVILANPPFMSPKGGIIPHKRFSVQSNRSEVLFVDYMAEHLKPAGRAGIIVPEGIIFQSANAYKQLRKYLIEENYLVCVASLPGGVFNPYAGVKTSILFFDRTLAKKTDKILFVKIEADGFDLGAQRRPVEKNDLPEAVSVIQEWFDAVREEKTGKFKAEEKPCNAMVVEKKKLAENGEYGLTGERYRETVQRKKGKWPVVCLGEVCEPEYGFTASAQEKGAARLIRITDINERGEIRNADKKFIDITDESKKYLLRENDLLVARTGATFGKTLLFKENYPAIFASFLIRLNFNKKLVLAEFYWSFSKTPQYWDQANSLVTGGGQPQFNGNALKKIRIPLPSLSVQQEIVAEIECYQKVIDGARQVVESWKPRIEIDPEWPMVKLGDVCEKKSDVINPTIVAGEGTYLGLENIESNSGNLVGETTAAYGSIKSAKNKFIARDILYGKLRPNLNKVHLAKSTGICSTDIYVLRSNKNALPEWLEINLRSQKINSEILKGIGGAQLPRVDFKHMTNILIPLPSLAVQQKIVSSLESERKAVDACKSLIVAHEEKIKKVIDRVWEG